VGSATVFNRKTRSTDAELALVRHDDAAQFMRAAGPFLDRNRAANSGFVAWAKNFVRNPPAAGESLLLLTVHQRDLPVGIALRREGGPLILGESDPSSASLVAEILSAEIPELQGIVGGLAACEAFGRTWHERTGRAHALRFHLRDYALTTMPVASTVPGIARLATEDDAAWLADWLVAFLADARVTDDPERARSLVPKRIAEGRFWLWEHRRERAMLGAFEVDDSAARIAPVYTPPEHRRRGYASALVNAVSRTLLQHGKRVVYLTTDLSNATSNNIYRRIGYEPVGDQYQFDMMKP
jgi:ribosomal protein S18 acetylase RimI-like enzyme